MPATEPPIAAPDAPSASSPDRDSLDTLTPTERDQWRMTGELPGSPEPTPDRPDQTPEAESSPAAPVEQAPSTEGTPPPASEPGKPAKKNAETRVQELLQERHALRERLAALESQDRRPVPDAKPAAPSPAPDPADDFPEFEAWAARPENEGKSYERYTRDLARHVVTVERQQEAHERAVAERVGGYAAKVRGAMGDDPETFWNGISPAIQSLKVVEALNSNERPTAYNYIASEIVQSDVPHLLMQHLSQHPDELYALAQSPSHAAMVRRLGRLEATLESTTHGSTPAPQPPPRKTVSQAPPPPTFLGQKPTDEVDDVDAAVVRDDTADYIRRANARELAARGKP